jgi:hypothetical protein
MRQVFLNPPKIEVITYILSGYNGIEPEINSKRSYRKNTNTWRLNNTHASYSGYLENLKNPRIK